MTAPTTSLRTPAGPAAPASPGPAPGWFTPADGRLEDFRPLAEQAIEEQKAAGVAGGDHFAQPGANDRIWGALDKFARRAPEQFADYYATMESVDTAAICAAVFPAEEDWDVHRLRAELAAQQQRTRA